MSKYSEREKGFPVIRWTYYDNPRGEGLIKT